MSKLVTFGETMLRLSPPGDERLERAESFDVRAAGAESNAAIAAQRMGASATWLSKLPNSSLGRRVVGELSQYGIETDVVWSEEGRQGTYYFEHGGRPRGSNVVYDRTNSAITTAKAEEFDPSLIRDARVFFTTGITPALSPQLRETTAKLLNVAHKADTTTAFDVNYRGKLWDTGEARQTLTKLLPGIDVLIIAVRDARALFEYEGDPRQFAHNIASQFDLTTVVVTRGSQGALAWHDNVVHDHDVYDTDTIDPVGTGDAFSGAFIARRLSGDDVHTALEYASATAALKRTIPGDVALVTKAEVEAVIADKNDEISR